MPIALVAMVAVTAVWGSSFAISKDLLTRLPVTDYLALRFLLAALVVGLFRPHVVLRAERRVVVHGVVLGLLYYVGQLVQFVGLQRTAATVSAFIVSMYVVFVPLFGALLTRVWPRPRTVMASLVAVGGLAAMSLRGLQMGDGELLTLCAAMLYAAHIVALGRLSRAATAYALAFIQLLTMGVCFLMVAVAAGGGVSLPERGDWAAFLYLAIIVGGVSMLAQTWAQAHINAATVAVLMVLEPVWAAVFGTTLWGERLEPRVLVGGALILAALLISSTGGRSGARTWLVRHAGEMRSRWSGSSDARPCAGSQGERNPSGWLQRERAGDARTGHDATH